LDVLLAVVLSDLWRGAAQNHPRKRRSSKLRCIVTATVKEAVAGLRIAVNDTLGIEPDEKL
jgi:hypothetical protein